MQYVRGLDSSETRIAQTLIIRSRLSASRVVHVLLWPPCRYFPVAWACPWLGCTHSTATKPRPFNVSDNLRNWLWTRRHFSQSAWVTTVPAEFKEKRVCFRVYESSSWRPRNCSIQGQRHPGTGKSKKQSGRWLFLNIAQPAGYNCQRARQCQGRRSLAEDKEWTTIDWQGQTMT